MQQIAPVISQNLYQIPNCSICLSQLSQQISNLSCGHVFHLSCIVQHFQYRGTCPNCQKRSGTKQVRTVIYPVVKNTQSVLLMHRILGQMSSQQKQQMQKLFKSYQTATQKNQKFQIKIKQAEKELEQINSQLNRVKVQFNKQKVQKNQLRNSNLELKKVIEHLHDNIKNLKDQNLQKSVILDRYQQLKGQYQKMKQLKKIMSQNNQSIISYKKELERQNKKPQQMCKLFIDMIMLKNLDVIKLKDKLRQFPLQLLAKQQQITKLQHQLERQKTQNLELYEKRKSDKKKIQDLKSKYRNLLDKYKAKRISEDQNEDFMQDSLSKAGFPVNKLIQSTNNIIKKQQKIKSNSILDFVNINSHKQQNISYLPNQGMRFSFDQNIKIQKKNNSQNHQQMKEQQSNSLNKNADKKIIQTTINSVSKPQLSSFGSFGGFIKKKKAEDKKQIKITNFLK